MKCVVFFLVYKKSKKKREKGRKEKKQGRKEKQVGRKRNRVTSYNVGQHRDKFKGPEG